MSTTGHGSKKHSIKVTEGQKVKQGQILGLCGNSGNSSEPHVYFHIQNVENMNIATGVKCYFDTLIVNGQIKTDYSSIKKIKLKAGNPSSLKLTDAFFTDKCNFRLR